MTSDFQKLMRDAGGFMRAGDLHAATASIQAALRGDTGATGRSAPVSAPPFESDVIDVVARTIGASGETAAQDTSATATPAAGERFIHGSYANAAMQRDYRLYVPPNAAGRSMPLVVMLHGCTQDPDDFAAGTGMNELARAQGFFVLYPAQSQKANPQRCWNWFKHSHQQRGRGEPALIAEMALAVTAEHGIDRSRVYAAGLSAGGAMAAILGSTYPDVFAAIGVHSGLAAGSASDLSSAMGAMRSGGIAATTPPTGMPTIVFHGDADATVAPANAGLVIAASMGAASAADVRRVEGSRNATIQLFRNADGRAVGEQWTVHGAGHAWSGGSARGSYSDPRGPDASAEMMRFFLENPQGTGRARE